MTSPDIDAARLTLALNELRLPAIKALWPGFAEQADKEGWSAARLLSALVEHELAERDRRRIERHLAQARLLPGKTLESFDFAAVPMLSRAHVSAITAGDSWIGKGNNILLFGPPGVGKSHLGSAIGLTLVQNGYRVLFSRHHRSGPEAPTGASRSRPRKRHRKARQVPPADPRRHHLRHQGSGRDQRAVRTDQRHDTNGAPC